MNIKCLLLGHDYVVDAYSIRGCNFLNALGCVMGVILCLTIIGFPIGTRLIAACYYNRDGICRRCEQMIFGYTDSGAQMAKESQKEQELIQRFQNYQKMHKKA